MKRCSLCKEEKTLDCFGVDRCRKDGRNVWCSECKNERNRQRYKGYNKTSHQKKKIRYYNILNSYSDKVCSKCNYTSNYWAPFDWHHVDNTTKRYELSSMVRHSEKEIIEELDKCILLCSNCHRLLHYEEQLNEIN